MGRPIRLGDLDDGDRNSSYSCAFSVADRMLDMKQNLMDYVYDGDVPMRVEADIYAEAQKLASEEIGNEW